MWAEIKRAPNRMLAEMWKQYFEGEGIPSLILPEDGVAQGLRERCPYRVFVPWAKVKVAEEALRKL
ncbi:MAG: hypothetical protein HY676_05915 [Chloroflexi bacterium]|nr:hypothetical protein [Chloroflexota bacterium]